MPKLIVKVLAPHNERISNKRHRFRGAFRDFNHSRRADTEAAPA